ncbi:BrnT family toxin [Propionivibrio sp.]|uniref:BrnT family toxin n=1 Tax=Propionivibrio sp. TaxID=2212460 RepID=UPI003BF1B689
MVTFDESKRQANITKHGIDLADVETAFDYPLLTTEDDRVAYGEQRLESIAWLNGRVVVLLWTERESGAHVFSCRNADKSKSRKYADFISKN